MAECTEICLILIEYESSNVASQKELRSVSDNYNINLIYTNLSATI